MIALIQSSSEEIGAELVFLRLFLCFDEVQEFLHQDDGVALVIHLTNQLFPRGLLELAVSIVFLHVI